MTSIAFFNNKGGVGKTSLVYHLAWMYSDLGLSVVAADLDPQANLTSMFLSDERLEQLWGGSKAATVFSALQPLLEGTGDVATPIVEDVQPGLGLLVGDIGLSGAEDELSSQWPAAMDAKPRAFRVLTGLARILEVAARERGADLILIDVGPSLGALNRAAMIAAERVVIPLASDLYSLQGLMNLGPTLRRWRTEWAERRGRSPIQGLRVPTGAMDPAGYLVLQHAVRLDRPVKAYGRWMARIPSVYHDAVLGESVTGLTIETDPDCLGTLKHYRSLMPLAQEARKPMFFLTPADGALGGHGAAVQACYQDFRALAMSIADRSGLAIP
jgi:cellulose biosynthesis protein BcsQ